MKEETVFTYRTRPTGDGRLYTWSKYDEEGQEVEVSPISWNTEADAEKDLRSRVSGRDVIATPFVHSINSDDNRNVVLERPAQDVSDENFGMAVREVSKKTVGDNNNVSLASTTPNKEAVSKVADLSEEVEHTPAEQKAIEKAQKADK